MQNTTFTPEESLNVIRTMLEKTRQNFSDQGKYFLVWGWGAFLACIGQFLLKVIFNSPYHYYVWLVTLPCILISIIISKRDRQKIKVKSYTGDNMRDLWIGLGITFFVLSMIITKIGWQYYCYPFFIMLYGLGTFLSGRILHFNPFVIGAIITWLLAIAAIYAPYDYQILMTAAALLVSYLIPGYMFRIQYRNNQKVSTKIKLTE